MFSSLASFIFGSNTSATTNQDHQQLEDSREPEQQQRVNVVDAENTIEVTSSTPSVTGATGNNLTRSNNNNRRGKNRRSKNNRNNTNNTNNRQAREQQQKPPSITKLLTPSDDFDEDLDEDDWFIVEKEDEEESLPRSDSEEELSIVEVKAPKLATTSAATAAQRRRQLSNSHSLYGGPRPQQQRNYLQRARNNGVRGGPLSILALSTPRSLVGGSAVIAVADVGGGVTQSLYAVPPNGHNGGNANGQGIAMEESWFVTPPPCFTSIGPINMETSPFENLLIEHPSMSVYHSIRSAQEATESFVNLDLGVEESQKAAAAAEKQQQQQQQAAAEQRNSQAMQQHASAARLAHYSAAQLKQEFLARNAQKSLAKSDRQLLCRGAIKRSNKVRDFQSKGNRQRRADMQHCKVISGANNNRKGGF